MQEYQQAISSDVRFETCSQRERLLDRLGFLVESRWLLHSLMFGRAGNLNLRELVVSPACKHGRGGAGAQAIDFTATDTLDGA